MNRFFTTKTKYKPEHLHSIIRKLFPTTVHVTVNKREVFSDPLDETASKTKLKNSIKNKFITKKNNYEYGKLFEY